MAQEGGINVTPAILGANRNQTSLLERRREDNPNDPAIQAPRREEQMANRARTAQDRVDITNELNPVRQNENPLNRRIQAVRTNQSPRVRNVARQFQPRQNAIAQRNQAQEMQARQEDRARFEAGLSQIPGQNLDTQRTAVNPPQESETGQTRNAEQRNTGQTPDLPRPIEEQGNQTRQETTAADSAPEVDTANVQGPRATLENRQETPVVEPPPQNTGQTRPDAQANQNPPTPGLQGSISQRAEAAAERAQVEQDRAEAAREAARQQRERITSENNPASPREPQAAQNRNPIAAQTRVGENVDRLI
ncbi:MAG: hypothetical protein ACE5G9_11155 [Nitrospinales bacterium]